MRAIARTIYGPPEVLETLAVLLDKNTLRRIKLGERELRRKQYVVAGKTYEIRRALPT
ncbi:MAG TPA: hypothetical protein VLV18_08905 [Terriglobales bacterium]|nr:hypothetical protein [Terriglobales bacterium]